MRTNSAGSGSEPGAWAAWGLGRANGLGILERAKPVSRPCQPGPSVPAGRHIIICGGWPIPGRRRLETGLPATLFRNVVLCARPVSRNLCRIKGVCEGPSPTADGTLRTRTNRVLHATGGDLACARENSATWIARNEVFVWPGGKTRLQARGPAVCWLCGLAAGRFIGNRGCHRRLGGLAAVARASRAQKGQRPLRMPGLGPNRSQGQHPLPGPQGTTSPRGGSVPMNCQPAVAWSIPDWAVVWGDIA